jgi:hypothetical protein
MSTPPPPASNPDESIFGHILRVTKNSCTKCFGVVQTTDEYAKIKYKEIQTESRKKQFGVEFLKLIHDKASEEEKQACIDKALADTAAIEKEIDVLKAEIARVNAATNEKIVPKPGVTAPAVAAASTTTTTTTSAAAPMSTMEAPVTTTAAATIPAIMTETPTTAVAAPPTTAAVAPTEPASAGVEVAVEDVNMEDIPLQPTTADTK